MLKTRSMIPPPPVEKPVVKVRVLTPIFVAGIAHEIGATATVSLSDAQSLQSVGRVEII